MKRGLEWRMRVCCSNRRYAQPIEMEELPCPTR